MTYLLVVSLVTNALLVYLFLSDRAKEREFWAVHVAEEVKERASLLNRIQAPEQAVALSIEPDDTPNFLSQYDEFKVTDES